MLHRVREGLRGIFQGEALVDKFREWISFLMPHQKRDRFIEIVRTVIVQTTNRPHPSHDLFGIQQQVVHGKGAARQHEAAADSSVMKTSFDRGEHSREVKGDINPASHRDFSDERRKFIAPSGINHMMGSEVARQPKSIGIRINHDDLLRVKSMQHGGGGQPKHASSGDQDIRIGNRMSLRNQSERRVDGRGGAVGGTRDLIGKLVGKWKDGRAGNQATVSAESSGRNEVIARFVTVLEERYTFLRKPLPAVEAIIATDRHAPTHTLSLFERFPMEIEWSFLSGPGDDVADDFVTEDAVIGAGAAARERMQVAPAYRAAGHADQHFTASKLFERAEDFAQDPLFAFELKCRRLVHNAVVWFMMLWLVGVRT